MTTRARKAIDPDTNGNIVVTPDGTGIVDLDGLEWDNANQTLDFADAANGTLYLKHSGRTGMNWYQASNDLIQISLNARVANPTQSCQIQLTQNNAFLNLHGGNASGSNIFLYGRDHSAKSRQGFVWIEPSSHANASADGKAIVGVNLSNTNSRFEIYDSETRRLYVNKSGDLSFDGDLDHNGSNVGFYGTAPVAQSAAYSPTNVVTDRAYDADSTTLAEVADVLGTLIADLQATGLIG